jgi:hypothetical protein
VLGLPAALLAAVFLAIGREVEHWLWTDLPHDIGTKTPPWHLVIGLPAVSSVAGLAVATYQGLLAQIAHWLGPTRRTCSSPASPGSPT